MATKNVYARNGRMEIIYNPWDARRCSSNGALLLNVMPKQVLRDCYAAVKKEWEGPNAGSTRQLP